MIGNPPGYYDHAQHFPDEQSVMQLLELTREYECSVDPGVSMDTIVVNNDTGWQKGNRYLENLDGQATFSGRFVVLHRPNFGRSFGGYNAAFQKFRNQYDYWMFTEDDILVIGNNYFKTTIDSFTQSANIGFVAIQGLSTAGFDKKSDLLHAHGGVGLTHIDVLRTVDNTYGYLPHCRIGESQDRRDIIIHGEIAFTHAIHKAGYKLVTVESEEKLYVYAYDSMRGIEIP